MFATNHVITGGVFTLVTVDILPWWVVLPAAFLLHFVLDSLPHFGQRDNPEQALNRLKWLLPLDAFVAAVVLVLILLTRPDHWQLAITGAILCASPDLWSAPRFFRFLKNGDARRTQGWFSTFHSRIQWGERPWGIWVEAAWMLCLGFVLLTKLNLFH